jgi:hypothetical protein
MHVKATVGGVEYSAQIRPSVYLAFEVEHDKPYFEALQSGRVETTLWITWKAMVKAGHTAKPFDGFVDDLDDLPEFSAEAKDDAGPLPPAA